MIEKMGNYILSTLLVTDIKPVYLCFARYNIVMFMVINKVRRLNFVDLRLSKLHNLEAVFYKSQAVGMTHNIINIPA